MFERYTESARRVIFFARYEAVQRGSDKITTAHILLGLIQGKDSRADVVGSLRAKIPDPCELLGIPHRPAMQIPLDKKKGPRLDDNSKKALAYAAQEAERDRRSRIDTDHLLLGLLSFPNEASPALEFIPLDLASARVQSKRHREEFPAEPGPRIGAPGILYRPLMPPFAILALIAVVGLLLALIIRLLNY